MAFSFFVSKQGNFVISIIMLSEKVEEYFPTTQFIVQSYTLQYVHAVTKIFHPSNNLPTHLPNLACLQVTTAALWVRIQ